MFKKLVSNLPYSPGLMSQVGFYAERLRQEKAVRRLSFLFVVLAMGVQMIAVIYPPERSLAASSNHIINGLRTKQDLINAWQQPGSDIPDIYGEFGVTLQDIRAMSDKTVTIDTRTADYWSIGRNSLQVYSDIEQQYKNNQVAIQYRGKNTTTPTDDQYFYQRQLRAWDVSYPYSKYQAFKGSVASTGETFWIIIDCGNLTTTRRWAPPPTYTPPPTPRVPVPTPVPVPIPIYETPTPTPTRTPPPVPKPITPELKINKSILNQPSYFSPGDTFTYQIEYRNRATNSLAENVKIEDQLDTRYFTVIDTNPGAINISGGFMSYERGGLYSISSYNVIRIKVRLKDQISSGTNICNTARITASNANSDSSKVCFRVITLCPYDSNITDSNPNCVNPTLECNLTDTALNGTAKTATFRTNVTSSNPNRTTVKKYVYEYGDGNTEEFSTDSFTHETSHKYKPDGYDVKVTVYYRTTNQPETSDKSIDCISEIDFEEDEILGRIKSATNLTKEKEIKGNKDVVDGGDIIEFELTTTNDQGFDRINVDVVDYIGDVLDYAKLDETYLEEQGGSFDEVNNKIIWEDNTVPANASLVKTFRVKIKDPIPATNSPSRVSTDFDCKITNEYGNQIAINVKCPVVKGLEKLPNTGPGASVAMMASITTVVGYFFARSQLLSKEIDLIRRDYVATGGA